MKTAIFVLLLMECAWAGGGFFQHATVAGMQMTECVSAHRSVMAALSGTAEAPRHDACAEYILVSQTTVFRVQASKSAPLLLPADEVFFRAGKGALVLRRDDQQDELEVKVVCMQLRGSKEGNCAVLADEILAAMAGARH